MKKIVFVAFMLLGGLALAEGGTKTYTYNECLMGSAYGHCLQVNCYTPHASPGGRSSKSQNQCKTECEEKYYEESVNLCKEFK